eukprot:s71_g32.t1
MSSRFVAQTLLLLRFWQMESRVQHQLRNVQQISATDHAFAAILADGSVVTWGDPLNGGDSSRVQHQLRNVQQICGAGKAFAAILADGSVVTWGDPLNGGDSSRVQHQLRNVQEICGTHQAFASILEDGSLVTWGNPDFGGNSSTVQHELEDFLQLRPSGMIRYRVSQAPGGPTSINLSWNDAPNRAASPGGKMRPEVMPPAGRAPSPGPRFEAAQQPFGAPARAASPAEARRSEAPLNGAHGAHGRPGNEQAQPFAGAARAPSPASRYEAANAVPAVNGSIGYAMRPPLGEAQAQAGLAAGLAGPPQQRHPCYGDPQVGFSAQARYGEAHGRHPCAGDPQAPAAGARPAPAPQVRHPCYGDPQVPTKRTPSPGGRRVEAHPANNNMPAAGFQAQQNRGGGAPYAYDGAGGGLPPPLPRQVQEPPYGRDPPGQNPPITREPRVSSNAYACGGNQNCGNVITDRRSTRVSHPPGGGSSICFG